MRLGFSTDRLEVCNFGWEDCAPGHLYGPAIRDHYLIHYVASGRGMFYAGGKQYALGTGQGFFILPGEATTYRADEEEPWSYGWVGFMGEDAARLAEFMGLSAQVRLFEGGPVDVVAQTLRAIYRDASSLELGALAALGGLFRFAALVGQGHAPGSASPARQYLDRAMWFMRGRCADPIKVTDIARFVGLSRSQLFRVFQAELGRSPKQALQELRVEQAERLLTATELPLSEIAASVSLGTAQRLSEAFARHYGVKPRFYRQQAEPRPDVQSLVRLADELRPR